ncbi:hypothetical protein BRAS3809_6410009 [Bradyrhizobium sp. STM 3809]|nr:hypothetical protein BRAS3809_6410009 [Bradyrhizobium sp. STM 3809]
MTAMTALQHQPTLSQLTVGQTVTGLFSSDYAQSGAANVRILSPMRTQIKPAEVRDRIIPHKLLSAQAGPIDTP